MSTPEFADTVRPLDLPDMRLNLVHHWQPNRSFEWIAKEGAAGGFPWTAEEIEHAREVCAAASLFWVSSEFTNVIESNAKTLPMSYKPGDSYEPPAEKAWGLVVFERPVSYPAWSDPTELATFRAFTYAPILLVNYSAWFLRFIFYQDNNEVPGLPSVIPAGLCDWRVDHALNEFGQPDNDLSDEARADAERDRRRFAAFNIFVNQRVLADVSEGPIPRYVRRRCERANLPSDVKVIKLRRSERQGAHRDPVGAAVEWSHRWIVDGHWRHQACGPELSERRWTFIQPHVKGPADKPLVVKDSIHAVVQ